jgi:hypothetical protein
LYCDQTLHNDTRGLTFSCLKASGRTDFKIDDREWLSEITVGVEVGSPFRLDPPEPDLGTPHEFALGHLVYNPGAPKHNLAAFVWANAFVTPGAFAELVLYRHEVSQIEFHVGGPGASLDYNAAPRWTGDPPGKEMHLFIYDLGYSLAPPRPNNARAGIAKNAASDGDLLHPKGFLSPKPVL